MSTVGSRKKNNGKTAGKGSGSGDPIKSVEADLKSLKSQVELLKKSVEAQNKLLTDLKNSLNKSKPKRVLP